MMSIYLFIVEKYFTGLQCVVKDYEGAMTN